MAAREGVSLFEGHFQPSLEGGSGELPPSWDEGTAAVGAMRQLQIPHGGVGGGWGLEQGA